MAGGHRFLPAVPPSTSQPGQGPIDPGTAGTVLAVIHRGADLSARAYGGGHG